MRYLCLVYAEESKIAEISESEINAHLEKVFAYREELTQNGHYIASNALESVESAITLRVRHGMLLITDGPFAETKEQLGGFYLIDAKDLNEAIRVASKMPPARWGCIEVRPIKELDPISAAAGRIVMNALNENERVTREG